MFFARPLIALFLVAAAPGMAAGRQDRPAARWSTATDLEMVTKEGDSLAGLSRLAVNVAMPEDADPVSTGAIVSTIVFRLEQAGLVVVPTRAVEEPLLSVTVRRVGVAGDPAGSGRVAYRIDVDLLQLVRLADRDQGRARLMMASTWHAGTFGTAAVASVQDTIRDRIGEVVDAFIADHRAANPAPPAPPVASPSP